MSTDPPTDLFDLQRRLVAEWEKGLNALLTQEMSKSEFAEAMNRANAAAAPMQKALATYRDKVTPATKEDVAKLGERLKALEDQVGLVLSVLKRLAPEPKEPRAARSPGVPRTKRYTAPTGRKP
jgi:hypothetical protein